MNKKLLTPILLAFVLVLSSFSKYNSVSKKTETNPNEIIVAFEKLNSKQLLDLDAAIANIPGVKNFGYCQKKNLYFFSYDERTYKSEEQALEAITIHTKQFHPLLKVGTSSEQISKSCNI